MDTSTLHDKSYEVAEALAPSWERRREFVEGVSAPVREWLVRELDPKPGQTVLELAAGVGDTGFEAAALLGSEGRLISTDFSPGMVDAARRRATELGVNNSEHRVMNAERMDLDDDSVDGALCRFGYMLMVDTAAALAETRRVLRPGGRVALAVWGAPERNPFFAVIGRTLVEGGYTPPPPPEAPNPMSMASADLTRELLNEAGFDHVRTEEVAVVFPFPDVEECVAVAADTAGPMALVLQGLSDDDRAAVTARLEEALVRFEGPNGYELPGLSLVAVAS